MNEFSALKSLAYSGGEWVIWLLIAMSVLTVAVIIERFLVIRRETKALGSAKESIMPHIEGGNFLEARRALQGPLGSTQRLLAAALALVESGPYSVEERVAAARIMEKKTLERRLLILGTLGNNAPFIGLFGTVLGVIKAFHDLAETASAGPEAVMQGLSEALIATAVGLLVAIPAVMAYNYFQKQVNDLLGEADAFCLLVLAQLKAQR